MTPEELRKTFSIYFEEIEKCESTKCYWALLHILLAIPDICGSLEEKYSEVGDRYVNWCDEHLSNNSNITSADWYQMRNSLFHSGSSTVNNFGKKHKSGYSHFSYIDPDKIDVTLHNTVDDNTKILNIHIIVLATEIKDGLNNWFNALQKDKTAMANVKKNINFLTRSQQKKITDKNFDLDDSILITKSST